MSFYAGGEYLCLVVCEALQEAGYHVCLASQSFDPPEVERIYGMGRVMQKCDWIQIPKFKASFSHFMIPQQLAFSRRVWPMFQKDDPDIVFSTQSSPFFLRERMFHFVYNADDLFAYPAYASPIDRHRSSKGFHKAYFAILHRTKKLFWDRQFVRNDWFFAIGTRVLQDLRSRLYLNSSLTFPPCRINFRPKASKKRQVVQFARIIPDKRLELYVQIASKLAEYDFILVGRRDSLSERFYPGYADKLLSTFPKNLTYIEATMRERPDLLEESQVYVYTGRERGIILTMIEAIAAGCIPFGPIETGAADVLEAAQVGVVFGSIDEAISKLRLTLERELGQNEVSQISEKAKRFAPDTFKHWIARIANLEKAAVSISDYWPV